MYYIPNYIDGLCVHFRPIPNTRGVKQNVYMYVMFTSHMYIIYIYESMILHYVEDRRQKCIRNPRQPAEWFKFQNAFFSQPCRPPYVRRTQQVPALNWRHVHKPCTMCERRVYMRYIGMYIYNFIHVHTVTVKRSALYPVGYINTLYCTHTHTHFVHVEYETL